jgi:diguanylate cyclase
MEEVLLGTGPASFSSGILLGAVLLCAGLAVGIMLGRRLVRHTGVRLAPEEMQRVIEQLRSVTHGVSEDMSQYRSVMDLAQRRMKDLRKGPPDESVALLAQMTEANEMLQRRIQVAETSLSRQSEQIAAWRSVARTDSLTGLANRRAFDDEFQRRVAEFRRHGTRFLLMLLDIDRFKQLNDSHGHPEGDAVLAQLAKVLKNIVRDTDLVARYGGEEFGLLFPASELSQVTDSMERIRIAVATTEFRLDDQITRVTVSCGAAEPGENESAEALLRRADEALYAAKQAGRNRCFYHNGSACIQLTPVETFAVSGVTEPVVKEEDFRQVCTDLRRRLEEVIGK